MQIYGSSDNRYGYSGKYITGSLLHALDQLAFAIRQLIQTHSFVQSGIFSSLNNSLHFTQKIINPEKWMIGPNLLLESLYLHRYPIGTNQSLRDVFKNVNSVFFYDHDQQNESAFSGYAIQQSPLYNCLVEQRIFDSSIENQDTIDRLGEWCDQKMQLSKDLKSKLKLQCRSAKLHNNV